MGIKAAATQAKVVSMREAVPSALADRLAGLIRAHCPHDGKFHLRIPGVHVARYSKTTTELIHSTPRPVLCIVAQGAKTMLLGTEAFVYDSSRLLVLSVDIPVAAMVSRASPAEPYLSLIVDLEPRRIAELVLRVFPNGIPKSTVGRGLGLAPSNPAFLDAAARLLELLATPEDAELLAPLIVDEILIRLLRSPAIGAQVAQIGLTDSNVHRVMKAIDWLRTNYAQPMAVEHLAELANMSASSFHQHFKAVTSMSPLHYQKVIRLQEARRLMLASMLDAGAAGRQVGYLSASQFSREYARFFGDSPTRDIARLAQQGLTAADVLR